MNQEKIYIMLDEIFEEQEFDVTKNCNDKERNVFVCRKGEKKRLIGVWPNYDLLNILLKKEVWEKLENNGFQFEVQPITNGNQHDYRKVSQAHVQAICRAYLEIVENEKSY
jgi:hypothetical protein